MRPSPTRGLSLDSWSRCLGSAWTTESNSPGPPGCPVNNNVRCWCHTNSVLYRHLSASRLSIANLPLNEQRVHRTIWSSSFLSSLTASGAIKLPLELGSNLAKGLETIWPFAARMFQRLFSVWFSELAIVCLPPIYRRLRFLVYY